MRENRTEGTWKTAYAKRGQNIIGSVFFRLMVSYIGLVFVLALWTSSVSYLFFQQKYNDELERIHRFKVRNIAGEFTAKVIDYGKLIYLDASTELLLGSSGTMFGEDDQVKGNYPKINVTHKLLGSLVGKYGETVESITLYYRKADLYLSFPFGVHFGDDAGNAPHFAPFKEFLEQKKKIRWTNRKGESPSLYRSFPILAEGDAGTVVVSVGFRIDALRYIISAENEGTGDRLYVLDGEGKALCSSPGAVWDSSLDSGMTKLTVVDTDGGGASGIVQLSGTRHLIVSVPIADSGWRLVSVTPVARLYSKGDSIRWILILICLAAIVFGLAISAYLSARIYNPLERLILRIKQLFGSEMPVPVGMADEYGIIGYTIDGLSAALERSRPLIKHEVAVALLVGDIAQLGDTEETLSALRIGAFPEKTAACLVTIRPRRDEIGDIEHRLLRYRIAELFEGLRDRFVLACVLPSGEIGLALEYTDPKAVQSDLIDMINEINDRFQADVRISVGDAVKEPAELRGSFETARKISAYAYFYPEKRLFSVSDGFLDREKKTADIGSDVFDLLAEGIRRHDAALASSAVNSGLDFARSGRASADVCRRELARLARSLAETQSEMFPGEAAGFRAASESVIASSDNVDEYRDAMLANISLFSEKAAPSQDERLSASMAEVKRLIDDDLKGDLSLSRLSDAVSLSPGYLGKVFAAVTGTHLVDYVTERRLSAAAKLLRESDADIQDIGRQVGFNSPAYFIRRFKERFGRTPYDYRRMSGNVQK